MRLAELIDGDISDCDEIRGNTTRIRFYTANGSEIWGTMIISIFCPCRRGVNDK